MASGLGRDDWGADAPVTLKPWGVELSLDFSHAVSRAWSGCCVGRWLDAGRLQQRRNLVGQQRQGPPAGFAEARRRDGGKEHGSAIADPGPAVQVGSRTRSLEAGPFRQFRAVENLSDLPLVG